MNTESILAVDRQIGDHEIKISLLKRKRTTLLKTNYTLEQQRKIDEIEIDQASLQEEIDEIKERCDREISDLREQIRCLEDQKTRVILDNKTDPYAW
jgi:predicted transcriptional regulator